MDVLETLLFIKYILLKRETGKFIIFNFIYYIICYL